MRRSLLAIVLLLLLTPVAGAQQRDLDAEAREIAKGLRCYVCENLSVADSPSDSATEMRSIIRKKLENGESREQIRQYFVDRYGVGILLEPPRSGFSALLWLQPVVVLLAGLALLVFAARRWTARRPPAASEPDADEGDLGAYDTLLREELRRRSNEA